MNDVVTVAADDLLVSGTAEAPASTVVQEPVRDVVVIEQETVIIHEVEQPQRVTEVIEQAFVITAGVQGPQGPQGAPGPAGAAYLLYTAAIALGGHRVVRTDNSGYAIYASNDVLVDGNAIVGLTVGAVSAGAQATVQNGGEIIEPSWSWTAGLPVYLGTSGLLTQTPPASPAAQFSLIVGFAVTPTKLFINLREPIVLT